MCDVPYSAAVLTRDPFHIETLQTFANYWDSSYNLPSSTVNNAIGQVSGVTYARYNSGSAPAGITPVGVNSWNWPTEETRGQAWKVRDLAQATLATPASTPSWLVPQSNFADCLHQLHDAYMYRINNPWDG
jgi:hypothetical protein